MQNGPAQHGGTKLISMMMLFNAIVIALFWTSIWAPNLQVVGRF